MSTPISAATGSGLLEALHTRALERNANAGLEVCNEARSPVAAAIARATGDGYEARGWWRIEPGAAPARWRCA
jgi:uncharacterized membrane protein